MVSYVLLSLRGSISPQSHFIRKRLRGEARPSLLTRYDIWSAISLPSQAKPARDDGRTASALRYSLALSLKGQTGGSQGHLSLWLEFERRLPKVPIICRLEQGTFTIDDYKMLLLNLRPQVIKGSCWDENLPARCEALQRARADR